MAETNNLKYNLIQKYLHGQLNPKEMHELEREALEDPFFAEALEGYAALKRTDHPNLSFLQRQLEERISLHEEKKNKFYFTWQRLSVAATAGLLFISASILFWMKGTDSSSRMASSPKQVEVKLTPSDNIGKEDTDVNADQKSVITPVPEDKREKIAAYEGREQNALNGGVNEGSKRRNKLSKNSSLNNSSKAIVAVEPSPPESTFLASSVPDDISGVRGKLSGIASSASDNTFSSRTITIRGTSTLGSSLSGKVVSGFDGSAIPGVAVKIDGLSKGTTTNEQGEFSLADTNERKVLLSYIGYVPKVVDLQPGKPLLVTLDEKSAQLNEIVVTGHANGIAVNGYASKKINLAEPAAGWKKYLQYVENNKLLKAEQDTSLSVSVLFNVDSLGRPENLRIESGINERYNNEAIRLIKEGPLWKPLGGSGKTVAGRATVTF